MTCDGQVRRSVRSPVLWGGRHRPEPADERRERLVELALSIGGDRVSKTSDDLPDPGTPTNAVIARFGICRLTSRRLFSRAPVTEMYSGLSWVIPSSLRGIPDRSRPLSPSRPVWCRG